MDAKLPRDNETNDGLWGWAAVMRYCGLPSRAISRMIKAEGFPAIEVAGTIYSTKPLIKAWIARRMQAHTRHGVAQAIATRYEVPLSDGEDRAIEILSLAAMAKARGLWHDVPPEALFRTPSPRKAARLEKFLDEIRPIGPPPDERG